MTEYNTMQTVKRRFFAMRNGVIADVLRRNGSPFRIIFGLVLPQIEEIARDYGVNMALGQELWANNSTRESMLMAPLLMDNDQLTIEQITKMIEEAPSTEIIDQLVHKLLRRRSDSLMLAQKLSESAVTKCRYGSMRLLWHFVYTDKRVIAKEIAEKELKTDDRMTAGPARQIVEEVAFLESDATL